MLIGSENITKDALVAKKRIQRFIEEVPHERKSISHFITELSKLGDVYIFGGLIRDICLFGISKFSSDIDIIIEPNNDEDLQQFLNSYRARRNKFDGYRLSNGRWKFDVWEMRKTWAFKDGHIKFTNKFALFDTTFFNWDAVLYSVNEGKLYSPDNYFRDLSNLSLEINLETTPNQLGSFVRTLRLLTLEDISTGYVLTKYIVTKLELYTDEQLQEYEANSFNLLLLSYDFLADIRGRATNWNESQSFKWFSPLQLSFMNKLIEPDV